jgi:hypothetical protein
MFESRNTYYTTLDRQMTFCFDFVQTDDGLWRVYIITQPDYDGRLSDSVRSHRLQDQRGQFICWDAPIRTLNAAKGVARAWGDATQTYIRTGTFLPPGGPRQVPDWSSTAATPWSGSEGPVPGTERATASPRPPSPGVARPNGGPRRASHATFHRFLDLWRT